uniref:Uncharacterized protein n=1 Tax=Helianthus annuus TaxID=4232 RepID=A0A251TMH4_HELAN
MAVRNLNLGFCFFRFVEDLKRLERESIRLEREATRREKRRSRTDHGSGRLHQCISAHLHQGWSSSHQLRVTRVG